MSTELPHNYTHVYVCAPYNEALVIRGASKALGRYEDLHLCTFIEGLRIIRLAAPLAFELGMYIPEEHAAALKLVRDVCEAYLQYPHEEKP